MMISTCVFVLAALLSFGVVTVPWGAQAQTQTQSPGPLPTLSYEQLEAMAQVAQAEMNGGGDYEKAARLYRTILAQVRQTRPSGHIEIEVTLFNLITALRTLGRYDEAEPLTSELLTLRRAAIPARPLAVAQSLGDLAKTLSMRSRASQALVLNEEALAILEAHLPAGDTRFVESWINTALILMTLDRNVEAETLLRRALVVTLGTKGADHGDTLRMKSYLAEALGRLKRHSESLTLYREILEVRRRLSPPHSPLLAEALFNVGIQEATFGDKELGIKLLTDSLALQRQTLGANSAVTVRTLTTLSGALQLANRSAEAEPYSKQALVIARQMLEPTDRDLTVAFLFHAALLTNLNRFDEALMLTEEALGIETQRQPGYHRLKSSVRVGRAAILLRLKRSADSYIEIRKAGEELLAGPGSNSGLDREARTEFDSMRGIFSKQMKIGWESAHKKP